LLERLPDGTTRVADPAAWVANIIARCWFYSDGTSPRRDQQTLALCDAILRGWGFPR